MKQRYIDYAAYNVWANNRIINDLTTQDDDLLSKAFGGSFPTIRDTIIHIWFAETGWLSRLSGNGWQTQNVDNFIGDNQELYNEWKKTSEAFLKFVQKADLEKGIQIVHDEIKYSIPSREIAHTVFNHGSYHRGQIVFMMRQSGVSKITQTDYIEWVRETERTKMIGA